MKYPLTAIVTGLALCLPIHADTKSAELHAKQKGQKLTIEQRLQLTREETTRQNENAFSRPKPEPRQTTTFNPNRNLYFGDTHVHTALSFDSYLSGNRLGLRDAYRFANGEPLTLPTGEVMQLSRPLDFVVMTDHAEGFGLFVTCSRKDLSDEQKTFCASFDRPNRKLYRSLRGEAERRPPIPPQALYADRPERSLEDARTTWQQVVDTAEEFNKPGQFTAFAGYEYSPPLPQKGKIHRNVIFRNSDTPNRAVSAFDAATVLDLWRSLEQECTGACDFLTIPHNLNKTWGLAYSGVTIDGDPYTTEDWALRGRNEPLAEIFQIKGNSECGYGVGASDEECNFELVLPICEGEQTIGCSGRTSFVREGLKIGLELNQKLGFNPLQTGFVGSTDTHSSNPGDTEEYDFRGGGGNHDSPATKRLGLSTANKTFDKGSPKGMVRNPGGLAAVWAPENTRDAIFDAMRNRETYATSGTRIQLRFFAGWDYPRNLLNKPDLISKAYQLGVPMGSVLNPGRHGDNRPEFLVWAVKDSQGTNLQRIQMVKAWLDNGKSREQVFDIACSDGLKPDPTTGRCPDNGAKVDLTDCSVSSDKGTPELKVHWRDPDFDPKQSAFYYVRVLENPSCRWSTYDALRLGKTPLDGPPATIQERAWSSPIWYTP
ncbi:DUF3604 domain-containing protein [Pseudomaricurvus alkylphenolicus]|jgi:hypothetical protein|uniref:DUF3604 domain-containing protein n=1 Tax=Pseudomaricurvus alkylphenolicus TaxID=1306991 RepID=UPI00141F394F|nr:DUF3604 domain-containing protein [Pseudomaricurvus alkylphenolicus]NIB43370.1 DUF3604 domain-containing protein [Pseudomaricurvus alkylphenolicus]